MTNRPSIDWRRWVAMLCIALMAVFAFDLVAEAAAPCANAECSDACDVGGCDGHDDNSAPCPEHHCCHGTVASQPGASGIGILSATLIDRQVVREAFIFAIHPDGLERPPRTNTVI